MLLISAMWVSWLVGRDRIKQMAETQFLPVSWTMLEKYCFQLAQKIIKKKLVFDRIVCISRGGLVIARIFSDFLNLPISNFTIVSYTSVAKTGKPKIVEKLGIKIKNERILLVDEIVDRGTTLKKALDYLFKASPRKVTSLALFIKPWSRPRPDLWQKKTGRWVIFPYESRETIEALGAIWRKEGFSKQMIKKRLLTLRFPPEEVDYFG